MSRYFGEFLGSFALVFAGTGAIVVNDVLGGAITMHEFRTMAYARSGLRLAGQALDSPDRSLQWREAGHHFLSPNAYSRWLYRHRRSRVGLR